MLDRPGMGCCVDGSLEPAPIDGGREDRLEPLSAVAASSKGFDTGRDDMAAGDVLASGIVSSKPESANPSQLGFGLLPLPADRPLPEAFL